ncbi:hypothetical protein I6E00_13205 [Staphylococcus aureus]|nr:hypothetical protein [Staphylococcus aureus]MBH4921918.1 hypothetical protein [Staphylococcus aureus]MBH4929528.1 hypothetical protein [Staphylococcus aureus]
MKIKRSFKLLDLLCYIEDNREKFKDKKIQFISDSGFNFVGIDSDNDIIINFSESHNYDLTMNKDLFTIDIDVDINKHVFNYLEVFYRENINPLYKKEVFMDCTIYDVLECIENPLESYITIIFQNKVIYNNGNVIDHE